MEIEIKCAYDEMVALERLVEMRDPKNRNQHPPEQIDELCEQFKFQGVRHPIIISKRSKVFAAGDGRFQAAEKLKMPAFPVNYQDFESEEQEYAFRIADNAIQGWSKLDLAGIHLDLPQLAPFEIERLAIPNFQFEPTPNENDADTVPEVPKVAKTKRGELWILGEHRLLIDDCTVKANVERLMAGEKADMVFTDPPYNVGFEYNEHDDTKKPYLDWEKQCRDWFAQWQTIATNLIITPGCYNLELWCRISDPAHIGCWVKENANTTGRITHLWKWEPIVFIGKFKRKRASDVFTHHVDSGFLRDPATGCHPCPKPMRLWEDIVENFSEPGHLIFEPFSGSGTTHVACEKAKRRCYGTEIDPVYADVILDRWEKYSGKTAHREDGALWSEVKNGT